VHATGPALAKDARQALIETAKVRDLAESREDKAQNPFASNGRYNLFRPLTALLDLPKMPFSRGT
jgi:hypothetical protein